MLCFVTLPYFIDVSQKPDDQGAHPPLVGPPRVTGKPLEPLLRYDDFVPRQPNLAGRNVEVRAKSLK